ncbi:choice-of-anchor Q domain-containing protein [Wenzhouxiangella sp. EGI_FJ10305]|uniref:choice-of-anchor Q domain-containing protein n=1 Tax=Wenzhouxiangella sp. EGI_FJ10305 TaxID=3243768 RepID=UPI0035E1440B
MRYFLVALLMISGIHGLQAATFNVNSTTDAVDSNPGDGICETSSGSGDCTLRAAVMEANEAAGPHTIELPAGDFVLSIDDPANDDASAGDLDVLEETTIRGSGVENTRIDGDDTIRLFEASDVLRIEDATLQNGFAGSSAAFRGGAVLASADLVLDQVQLIGNRANTGGAIYTFADFEIQRSLLRENVAGDFEVVNQRGHAMVVNLGATGTITATEISNNGPAPGTGGNFAAIFLTSSALLNLVNSSVVDNVGVGVRVENANLTLSHSTLAGNERYQLNTFSFNDDNTIEIFGSLFQDSPAGFSACSADADVQTSLGYNISDDDSCLLTATGDLEDTDAELGPLQDNGGPTLSRAPASGSPAINLVPPSSCIDQEGSALTLDQRGEPRPSPFFTNCDAGAIEFQFSEQVFNDRFES